MYLQWIVFIPYLLRFCFAQSEEQSNQYLVNLDDPIVCDCGFIDEDYNLWSDIWYADYSYYKTRLQYDTNYMVMDYVVQAKRNESMDRVFSTNNVKLDADGVTLSVKKNAFGKYTSAALGTKRDDFLYGTYRARMKLTDVAGTVSAFYFYRNDTCEIDIELLSRLKDPNQVYFAIQPQVYYSDGSAADVTNEKHKLPFNASNDYHEYRFDWMPNYVRFYVDNVFVREMTTNVPNSPGRVLFNHWTDGNRNFGGAAPEENAEMKVAQMNIFFNSSQSEQPPPCLKSSSPCSVKEIMDKNILPETIVKSKSDAHLAAIALKSLKVVPLICLLTYLL